jgi:hypothetical protein
MPKIIIRPSCGSGIFGRLEAMDLFIVSKLISQEIETTYLDGLGINFQSLFLVDKELLHDIALVALQLNHVTSLFIVDDGAVAGELLLDDLEDLLQIELGRNTLDGSQGLASIALYTS